MFVEVHFSCEECLHLSTCSYRRSDASMQTDHELSDRITAVHSARLEMRPINNKCYEYISRNEIDPCRATRS